MNDIRLGLRLCLRHPVLSLAAIVSLALGIGANTAIFTVLNGSVLRPLPYRQPDQLMVVWETRADNPRRFVAPANFLDWRRETSAFEGLAAFDDFAATLTGQAEAQRVRAVSASANFFEVLGIHAQVGRVMTAADDRADAPRVAVLTDGLWHRLFGGAAGALGQTLILNSIPHTVVGVLPAAFDLPMVAGAEVWITGDRGIPRSFPFPGDITTVRDSHIIAVIGRLATGVTLQQAQSQLSNVMAQLAARHPDTNAGLGVNVLPLHEEVVGNVRPLVVLLQVAGRLTDLAIELAASSSGFRRSLPPGIVTALADLVRSMNCYYSNLIEGHYTHPVDIERALKNDYSADRQKRNLQLEAKAHVAVQQWIDQGSVKGAAYALQTSREIHRRFSELLPDELLVISDPGTGKAVEVLPGELRADDVQIGRHVAISPGAVPRFMARFEEAYGRLGKSETILAAAAAHHRLLWIHPFADGIGRVTRLMSHASLLETLDTGSIWSVARGLARNAADYKQHLSNCDAERRGDLDGRGSLSEEALANFTEFFLRVCLDQVRFMEGLVQPDRLRGRILVWVEEEIRAGQLPARSGQVLEAVLFRGQLPRGDVPSLLGVSDRGGRRVVSALVERGVLASESTRAVLTMTFPAVLAARWMPGLFPEQSGPRD